MYEYKANLVEVTDGDTAVLIVDLGFRVTMTQRFRLYGINAPERKGATLEAARASAAALFHMLDGVDITVKTRKDKTEKYGRYLAELFVGDINVNERMVNLGHAVEYMKE